MQKKQIAQSGYPNHFVIGSGDEHFLAVGEKSVQLLSLARFAKYSVALNNTINLSAGDELEIVVSEVQGGSFSGRFTFGLSGAEITSRTISAWSQLSYTKTIAANTDCATLDITKENTANMPATPFTLEIQILVNGTRIL